MQTNPKANAIDLNAITWDGVVDRLLSDLNTGFEPGAKLSVDRMTEAVGNLLAELFDNSPGLAERGIVVGYSVDSHNPSCAAEDDIPLGCVSVEFLYRKEVNIGEEEFQPVFTQLAELHHLIQITFDPEQGYDVDLDEVELFDDDGTFLTESSIGDFISMMEASFIENTVDGLLCLPDQVGENITGNYCAEQGISIHCCDGSCDGCENAGECGTCLCNVEPEKANQG